MPRTLALAHELDARSNPVNVGSISAHAPKVFFVDESMLPTPSAAGVAAEQIPIRSSYESFYDNLITRHREDAVDFVWFEGLAGDVYETMLGRSDPEVMTNWGGGVRAYVAPIPAFESLGSNEPLLIGSTYGIGGLHDYYRKFFEVAAINVDPSPSVSSRALSLS